MSEEVIGNLVLGLVKAIEEFYYANNTQVIDNKSTEDK